MKTPRIRNRCFGAPLKSCGGSKGFPVFLSSGSPRHTIFGVSMYHWLYRSFRPVSGCPFEGKEEVWGGTEGPYGYSGKHVVNMDLRWKNELVNRGT